MMVGIGMGTMESSRLGFGALWGWVGAVTVFGLVLLACAWAWPMAVLCDDHYLWPTLVVSFEMTDVRCVAMVCWCHEGSSLSLVSLWSVLTSVDIMGEA